MAALMHLRKGSRVAAAALFDARTFSSTPTAGRKAAILGAAGGIGQPLGLLMKMNPYLEALSLYDIAGTPGVATDVSHINTKSIAKGYAGEEQLGEALEGCDIVIIPAGVPRKPGMTRDDLFKINASIVQGLVTACAKHCPNALLNIISNPVNSTVPIAAETLKKHSVYDPRKLFGVTTLDVIRARTFLARKIGADVADMDVPVIGGHAGKTILPLFSLATPQPSSPLSAEDVDALTKRTQDGGTEVVQAKAGKGSATLSMAYAGALFADACLRGLEGEQGVEEYSFVESTVTEVPFFSSKVILGRKGIEEIQKIPTGLTQYEEEAIKAAMPELRESIQKGVDFVNQNS